MRRRKREAKKSDKAPEPGHCEPQESSHLKREAETESGLIGVYWVVPIVGSPLVDDYGGDGERHQLLERHAVVGVDVEQRWGDGREPEPLFHHVDGDEEDGRNILLGTTLLAQRLECPKLVEGMKSNAMHVFGKRI